MAQIPSPRLRHYRTMTAICFVCNLPILSHQVGLVWQGGNGWDDLVREQVEESTLKQRLGGRRDSAAQISSISPPTETQETSPPTTGPARRRRSSLAQLTDILREWSGGGSTKTRRKAPLSRRETLADLARSLPWGRQTTTDGGGGAAAVAVASVGQHSRKRRESSADSGIKSIGTRSRRDSHQNNNNNHTALSDFRTEVAKLWQRRESNATTTIITASSPPRRGSGESNRSGRRDSVSHSYGTSRRGSGESSRSGRRDSTTLATPPPPKIVGAHKKRRDSRNTLNDSYGHKQDQRPSTSSTDSAPVLQVPTHLTTSSYTDMGTQALPPPTIIMSSVTPPATSPTVQATTPTNPLLSTRRDSTTQCGRLGRRDSRSHASPERRNSRLQRQNTAYDESCLPPPPSGGGAWGRRGSQPTLSPDVDDTGRKSRRDSLSPDSASRGGRRDSRTHLSPDRSGERDISPMRRSRRLRRQSTSIAAGRGGPRSPDSSSCSSRDPSPCNRPIPAQSEGHHRPMIRRQSTTEEILIARGFRRQSTTEEMIRCRNFRRQSSQSDDTSRYRGRRDSCAQITDGTIASMTVETSSTFFDSSTQT
ncbi:PREDICTED: uncharacterized protein LOC108564517, partial [Nicrophorus vespilloides]|uniref:Uncharacterized protein LOC108564517 n=1 Tax=Nicrophorus vespilloides TaxID=110193 RepID=A0ABM1MWX2_NICVS